VQHADVQLLTTLSRASAALRSPTVNGKRLQFATAISTVALTVAACGGGTTSSPPSTVTVTQTTQAASSAPALATSAPSLSPSAEPSNTYAAQAPTTAAAITIPDLIGQNAKIAEDKLKALGFTNVELASATSKYQNVFVPANWTVVGIEPAPGTSVSPGDDVVVKVTKP